MDPGDLAAQHGIFVPQHQQLGVLAQVLPHQHGGQTEQTTQEPVQIDNSSIRRSSTTDQHTRSAGQGTASRFRAPQGRDHRMEGAGGRPAQLSGRRGGER